MIEDYSVRKIPLRYPTDRECLIRFLEKHALRFENDIETAFGVFDRDDTLLGCGCAAGDLLKCFATGQELRGQNALGPLVSALTQERFAAGHYDLFVVTRTHNLPLFTACGFYEIAHTDAVAMLENRSGGAASFAGQFVQPGDESKCVGAIVMNCNPFTNGHRWLIENADAQCDELHLFVVEEDRSFFPTDVRYRLVREGTADLPNVRVHLSGRYMISAATFPTYFLKENEDAAALQCELDATIFAQKLAPALHVTKRFAGTEPFDPVTARYNETMLILLPRCGVAFCELPRLEQGGQAVSASRVRALLEDKGVCDEALSLVPEATRRYLTTEYQHGN